MNYKKARKINYYEFGSYHVPPRIFLSVLFIVSLIIASVLVFYRTQQATQFESSASEELIPGGRQLKYYGVDMARPVNDATLSTLASNHVSTVIMRTWVDKNRKDFDVKYNAPWQTIKDKAAQYGFKYVIWPDQGGDNRCGWEDPFDAPVNGNYITKVTGLLDFFASDPNFIGIVTAHEPLYNDNEHGCNCTIADMTAIKAQLKDYMATKSRTDWKVWNYIDNISDLVQMPGYKSADIQNVMDVAVTWQHCWGNNEGSCAGTVNKVKADRALISNAGLESKVELVFLLQTFEQQPDYYWPTLAQMQDLDTKVIETGALDGFMYYTWGAGKNFNWYDSDLQDHPDFWPEMTRIYNKYINPVSLSGSATPLASQSPIPTATPTPPPTPTPKPSPTPTPTLTPTPTPTPKPSATPTLTPKPTITPSPSHLASTRPTPTPAPSDTDTIGPSIYLSYAKFFRFVWVTARVTDLSGVNQIVMSVNNQIVKTCYRVNSCTYYPSRFISPMVVVVTATDLSTRNNSNTTYITVR